MILDPNGFREYDARWLYPEQIDLEGMEQLGKALGALLNEQGKQQEGIIVGNDYRSYSQEVKEALLRGLVASGQNIIDIGLSLSPTAYFAQSALGVPSVAMVTASHNENGWTGVKMGSQSPLTFGPEEMTRLKQLALAETLPEPKQGSITERTDIQERYIQDLIEKVSLKRKLRVVLACGNGTPCAFAPEVFTKAGCEVIPLHTELDWSFPHYTPNPEDMKMMEDVAENVRKHKADLGLAFDGDGDRCGFVDEQGEIIFADKMGLLIARHLASHHRNANFIADVKSTGLFTTDKVLAQHNSKTTYGKTGHSYMKRHLNESGALAGFEKSGHFFFAPPIGRGYDDGLLSGLLVCALVAESNQPLSALYQTLPPTFMSPSMSPHCPDEQKYKTVEKIVAHYDKRDTIAGRKITERIKVNGIRLVLEDGSWVLARASSNVPSLVIVVESTKSDEDKHVLFADINEMLQGLEEVGEYDQTI